ncbi:MAG: PglZ domain-containing protein [Chloroflexi bacterium]|nr:PglZ domain-containing protein [Chloroflexota bacterium]
MGKATDYLVNRIQHQVSEKGVVVWFDPDGTYAELAAALKVANTRVVRLGESYLSLRHEVDNLFNNVKSDTPPKLVIYVPRERGSTEHALDEFVYAGVVMQPEGESPALTTSLETVARHSLRFTSENLERVCDQIRKRQINSLAELDQLAEQGDSIGSAKLTLVFKKDLPSEIALRFLTDTSLDNELETKGMIPDLIELLNRSFDAGLTEQDPASVRARLRKHLLLTEFRQSLSGAPPESLATVRVPASPQIVGDCAQLVRIWRNRRDLQDSYIEAAERVQDDFGQGMLPRDWETLRNVETFPSADHRLQDIVAAALAQQPTDELIALAEKHQAGLWSQYDPDLLVRWSLIAAAGRLLRETERIRAVLKKTPPANALEYVERYGLGDAPWCQMDTEHRLLERWATKTDLDSEGAHASIEQLLAHARQEYSTVVDSLARKFVRAYADAKFDLGGVTRQNEIFARFVGSASDSPKTAYFMVDALRYEMARDLVAALAKDWQAELNFALALPPTITPVGMGALLPGAERGITLEDAGGGKLGVIIEGRLLKERKERVKWISEKVQGVADLKLEDIVPAKAATKDKIRNAKFVVVTSQEIDALGEGDAITQAREFMDNVLEKLGRAFRVLADLGVSRIIVTADHGYIFAEELAADATFQAPGGQTADLHRRVWVGRGGQVLDDVLRVSASLFNLGSDLDIASPVGLACFSAGGGRAFLHGGMSLQEIVIPVIAVQPRLAAAAVTANIEWDLVAGTPKLTTRFFSAQVKGSGAGMFEVRPPRVRVEVRARGRVVSVPVAATYGFQEATGEVELRLKASSANELEPDSITVMITSEVEQKSVSVLLMNAETNETLKKTDIEVAISI